MTALSVVGSAQARPATDSVRFFYRRGYRTADPDFRDNRASLVRLLRAVQEAREAGRFDRLVIRTYASPDGALTANERLAALRADSLRSCLLRMVRLPDSLVSVCASGVGWGLLREAVAASEMADRDAVVDILDHTPVWIFDRRGRIVDGRKKQLMELNGGTPYRYMSRTFFPDLRCGVTVSLLTCDPPPACDTLRAASPGGAAVPVPAASCDASPVPAPLRGVAEDAVSAPVWGPDADRVAATLPAGHASGGAELSSQAARVTDGRFAVKSNLLYDAILMPSLEAEFLISPRWSVSFEGAVAWWSQDRRHRYYQLATLTPEVRRWFRVRSPWHGHYVGLFVGGGWYDLENGGRGYRGEHLLTGLSYGYMFPVGRVLSLEAGVGLGYLHTRYREYLPDGIHYVYQQRSRMNYFGPVRLKLALVWRIGDRNRKGGVR